MLPILRPERPVALIDRRYWRDFQREFPPDLVVLEKIAIQGQSSTSSGAAAAAERKSDCGAIPTLQ